MILMILVPYATFCARFSGSKSDMKSPFLSEFLGFEGVGGIWGFSLSNLEITKLHVIKNCRFWVKMVNLHVLARMSILPCPRIRFVGGQSSEFRVILGFGGGGDMGDLDLSCFYILN